MDPQYLSIIITIVLAILGIIITILVVNKPRLKYYQIFPGKLFSKEINDISKLTIRYDNKKIEGELIFLQVLINNEGNCDIDSRDIYEPLTIIYNDPLTIIDAFIDKKTINVDLEFNKNIIYLKWDLLKKNEYFIINVILKHSDKNKLKITNRNLLKIYTTIIKPRIKNIHNVKKESYLKIITNRDKLFFIVLLSCLFMLLLSQTFNTIEINKINRKREILYKRIESNSEIAMEFNKNAMKYNVRVREYLTVQKQSIAKTIDLVDYIFSQPNDINMNDVKSKMIEIIRIMNSVDFPERDFDLQESFYPLSEIDNDKFISIIDIDELVLTYFFLSLAIFLFDTYIIINYLRTKKIAKYLK